jgi:hypothetical protein
MPIQLRWFFGSAMLFALRVASAQTCAAPLPFAYSFQNQGTASLQGTDLNTQCALDVSLDSTATGVGAAFLHYRRTVPSTSLRFGFRVDMSGIASELNLANRQVQLFSVSSSSLVGVAGNVSSQLLNVSLAGAASGGPSLRMRAATSGTPGNSTLAIQTLSQNVNVLGFEIDVGAGTAGSVQYWINADFSEPPTGVIDNAGAGLDNAAWGGIIAAELGMSSPTTQFLANNTGGVVVFDQIQTTDDTIFWQNFEFGQQ